MVYKLSTSIKPFVVGMFRLVFKKAREDPRSNFHVYVSAALMEYYCSKVQFSLFLTKMSWVSQCSGSGTIYSASGSDLEKVPVPDHIWQRFSNKIF
jgi:hypothetical protein